MATYPLAKGNKELAAAIKELSRLKYGRDREIVEAELMERTQLGTASKKSLNEVTEASL